MSLGNPFVLFSRASQAAAQRWTTVFDAVLMFKIIVLKSQYNLSDEMNNAHLDEFLFDKFLATLE
jgi:hypothetical protein